MRQVIVGIMVMVRLALISWQIFLHTIAINKKVWKICICRMKEGTDWELPNKGGCIGRWQWKTILALALKALNSLTGPTRCLGTPVVLMMNKNIAIKITFLSASQIGGQRLNFINELIIGYQGIHVPQLWHQHPPSCAWCVRHINNSYMGILAEGRGCLPSGQMWLKGFEKGGLAKTSTSYIHAKPR